MYFPRILAHDKLRGRFETFAPSGAVAGMLARVDAPAPAWARGDPEEPVLRPGHRPGCLVPEDRRIKLAALGVNTLHAVRSAMRNPLPARTLTPNGSSMAHGKYLSTRRFVLSVLASVGAGTRWAAKVTPAAAALAEIESAVRSFLGRLHDEACFGARAREDSYFVLCDWRLNSGTERGSPGIQLLIGLAAERPGEFQVYRLSQDPAGTKIATVTLNRLTRQHCSPIDTGLLERLAGDLAPQAPHAP